MMTDARDQRNETAPNAKVFISYSRKDIHFADRIDAALTARGYKTFIDRTDIAPLEEWWKRVEKLIVSADTVVFVISPDAVKPDTVARKEVAFAASLNKRFAPIVFRRVEDKCVPEELAKFNFIFFDVPEQFEASTDQLAKALNTDISWIRQHTELTEQARRWTLAGRPHGLLLRSPALEEGERWIASRPNDAPPPTDETGIFILASRRISTRRRKLITAALGVGFVIALTLAGLAYWQRNAALESQSLFLSKLSLDKVAAGDSTTGLLLALAGLPAWPSGYDRPIIPEALRSLNDSLFSLRESRVFSGHGADVNTVAFDPSGSTLLTSSDDHTARLWNVRTGELIHKLAHDGDKVSQALFSPDGRLIATASEGATTKIWDSSTGALVQTLIGHTASIRSVAFAKNGTRVVTSSADRTARIWSVWGNAPPTVLQGHLGPLNSAVMSPDGRSVLTTSDDQTAAIWDANTGRRIVQLIGHADIVTGGGFNCDGSSVVTFSHDNTARIWDVRAGNELRSLHHQDWVRSAIFCPMQDCVLTASDDKTVRIWGLKTDGPETVLSHTDEVRKAVVNSKGNVIASASRDGSITIWGRRDGLDFKKVLMMSGHEGGLLDIVFDPTEEFVATAARDHNRITDAHDATARLWRIAAPNSAATLVGQDRLPIRSSAIARDGSYAALGLESGMLTLWKIETGSKIAEVAAHEGPINAIAFSPDGTRMITASNDGTAAIWRVPALLLEGRLPARSKATSDASFGTDGNRAVIGAYDGSVTIWDFPSKQTRELAHYPSEVLAAKFAPQSDLVVIVALNQTVQLYDGSSGQIVREFPQQSGPIRHAFFSADKELLVTSGEDGRVIIWSVSSGQKIEEYKLESSAAFSALSDSGKYLITATGRKIAVWERGNHLPVAIYDGHVEPVTSAAFLPKSNRVLSVSMDTTAQLWELRTSYSELLRFSRSLAARCLSSEQLAHFGLPANTDAWCHAQR